MGYKQSFSEIVGTPDQLMKQTSDKLKQEINVMDLGIVISDGEDLYSSKGFASKNILLLRKKKFINRDGKEQDLEQPLLNDVPTRGTANVDDIVIVFYANSDIYGALGIRELKSQKFKHNINDAIAIGII